MLAMVWADTPQMNLPSNNLWSICYTNVANVALVSRKEKCSSFICSVSASHTLTIDFDMYKDSLTMIKNVLDQLINEKRLNTTSLAGCPGCFCKRGEHKRKYSQ